MTREEITAQAPAEHQAMLGAGSPSTVFQYALDRGWISQPEYDQARQDHGASWNYAGD